jgi:UDP-GlcNAc:undecaprenyl-phosphate GlcNAc-1-phosphate transferase
MLLLGIACCIIAMGVTWAVTPAIIRLAHAFGAVDTPGGRKVHLEPIPRIGGVAVFVGFVSGLAFAGWASGVLGSPDYQAGVVWWGLAVAATGMMCVGLVDDLFGLSYRWKLAAQVVGATWVWYCGFRIEIVSNPLGGWLEVDLLSLPLTVLWIVGITNAVNLIDGLDGLATGIALITTLAVAVIAFVRSELGLTAASVALAGSLLGFLRFNFNPARIFLGDSGSMFLGFVLAVMSVRGSQKGPTVVAIFVPMLVLGLPLLDTGLAIVRRLYRIHTRGVRSSDAAYRYVLHHISEVFLPDRQHIHHRLLEAGLSHRRAVLVLYAVGATFAAAGFALVTVHSLWLATLLVAVLTISIAVFFLLLYVRIWRLEARASAEAGARPEGGDGAPIPPRERLAAAPSSERP